MFENHPLNEIKWHKVVILFGSQQDSHLQLSTFQAIFKGAYCDTFKTFDWNRNGGARICFHLNGKKFNGRLSRKELISVELIFTADEYEEIELVLENLKKRMELKENSKYLKLLKIEKIERRDLQTVFEEFNHPFNHEEISLDFKIPFHSKEKSVSAITESSIIQMIESRMARMFLMKVSYKKNRDNFTIIPHYLQYSNIYEHNSKSQENERQLINGYSGKLYIKGRFKELLPYLLISSEIHLGNKTTNSLGYFKLEPESSNYFQNQRFMTNDMIKAIQDIQEQQDIAEIQKNNSTFEIDEEKLADKIVSDLNSKDWTPNPNRAFFVDKKDGKKRLIEQLPFEESIIAKYLYRKLQPIFDNIFTDESIGFRKGISREKAQEFIHKAIDDGFTHVVESDIEEFFPSIDHKIIEKLLNQYIPQKDWIFVKNIMKMIKAGYTLGGDLHQRDIGLSQGSSLSPILANIYLNEFDKHIKSFENIRLIRYADDFVLLAKSREDAEEILFESENYLKDFKLNIKKEKTEIKEIEDGFRFLGLEFSLSKDQFNFNNTVKAFKKALYILEPFVFLSLNGDSLSLVKFGAVIENVPLRRVSEIIIMNNVSFSNAFVKKCYDLNIPITMTLNSGYFITTIKPNSKSYFEISFLHQQKHNEISEKQRLEYAIRVIYNKVANYITMFKQRYTKDQYHQINELEIYLEKIEKAESIESLMGYEGYCAKSVFKNFNNFIIDKDFHLHKRVRDNQDYINSMLNYGYYLLFNMINTTIRAIGLNPYLGFVHSPKDNYESLVADIQELFRAKIDRFVIKLLNLKVIQKRDFIHGQRGYFLTFEGKRRYLEHFEGEINEKREGGISLREEIYTQIHIIKNWVVENKRLSFYKWD